ncbi:copper chaperone CopZ [Paenibacillus pinihumi]|uniref:copper chaperone CopZ n=1 Tax=Paenibacillus pinihumi TaxID=669462 RepID=UPI000411DCF7|nr:copper chaperone CopZ [Paenibacillus pinihumi]
MKEVTLQVTGMSCGHCVKAVEGALKPLGVQGEVDLAGNSVKVSFDESQVSLDQIKTAIEDQGYDVA